MKRAALSAILGLTLCGGADTAVGKTSQAAVGQPPVRIRYIVNDVNTSVAFYTRRLGFHLDAQSGPYFAMLSRDGFQLVLSPPKGPGGASQAMPDGTRPSPGGWNRMILSTTNLAAEVDALKRQGVHFRNRIVTGPGGKEILLDDPSGNPVELFQPA